MSSLQIFGLQVALSFGLVVTHVLILRMLLRRRS